MKYINVKVGRLLGLGVLCVLFSACSSIIPNATPASMSYDLGAPKKILNTQAVDLSGKDMIVIPEILVDGMENGLGIVYRYANLSDQEARRYNGVRWTQHPAEMLRFRMLQHFGENYPVSLEPDLLSSDVWILKITLEDFSQHITSDHDSTGAVQVRVTLGRNGRFVNQKVFRHEAKARSTDAQGAVCAITEATDAVLAQMLEWVNEQAMAQNVD